MTFTVTYRGADGAVRTEAVEAASRGECFTQMKAQGITPMSVKEGNSVSRRDRRGRRDELGKNSRVAASAKATTAGGRADRVKGKGRLVAYVVSVALVALVGGGVWWWMQRGGDIAPNQPEKQKKAALPKEVKPGKDEGGKADRQPSGENVPMRQADGPQQASAVSGASPTNDISTATNEVAVAVAAKPKPPFRNGVEQVLGWVFTCEIGKAPPPIPNFSPADSERLVSILLSKNPAEDGESEKVAASKEIVEAAKKELLDFLKEGGNARDFLSFYRGELMKAYHERTDAQKLVLEALREDAETGLAFAEEVNKKLSEKGIKPVFIPPKYRQ